MHSLRPGYKNLQELTRRNSNFGMIQVMQETGSNRRYYFNDYLTQNTYDTDLKQSTSMFTYMLHDLARAYTTNIDRVLCIGLGVGIVPMTFARENAKVDVIEINPAIVPVARDYFGLQPEKLNIHFGDGRYFVNQSTNHYDAVILDAFLGDSCPSHLMTKEAFTAIRRILKPEGTLVVNTFCDFEAGHDFFGASLYKTLQDVFPRCLSINCPMAAMPSSSPRNGPPCRSSMRRSSIMSISAAGPRSRWPSKACASRIPGTDRS